VNEKPFEPTPTRLAKARREGDHPLSHDVVAVAAFAGGTLALAASLPCGIAAARAWIGGAFSPSIFVPGFLVPVIAVCCGSIAGATLATFAQTHGLVLHAPGLRVERLSPLGGLRRLISLDGLRGALGAAVATGFVACVLAAIVRAQLDAARLPLEGSAIRARDALVSAFSLVAIAGAVLASLDAIARQAAWRSRLRMTLEEARRDLREHDGDPQTRSRRRRLHKSFLRGSLREVRRASFIVVNPTHVAIALRYAPPEDAVPTILVRAAGEAALRVRSCAAAAGIPQIENVDVARALWAHGRLGAIPRDLYLAVAQIVASLQRELRA